MGAPGRFSLPVTSAHNREVPTPTFLDAPALIVGIAAYRTLRPLPHSVLNDADAVGVGTQQTVAGQRLWAVPGSGLLRQTQRRAGSSGEQLGLSQISRNDGSPMASSPSPVCVGPTRAILLGRVKIVEDVLPDARAG